MNPDFWHDRWSRGQIGFHQGAIEPYLLKHWARIKILPGKRVFVPLCGKSLDLIWLRDQGHAVLGAELSDIAAQTFFIENNLPARRRACPDFDLYETPNLHLLRCDFLTISRDQISNVGAVYDRAALISWAPAMRRNYVDKIADITEVGTPMLLITLDFEQMEMNTPPFSLNREEVDHLYSRQYHVKEIERRDILSRDSRMREKGMSYAYETCYQLVRKQ